MPRPSPKWRVPGICNTNRGSCAADGGAAGARVAGGDGAAVLVAGCCFGFCSRFAFVNSFASLRVLLYYFLFVRIYNMSSAVCHTSITYILTQYTNTTRYILHYLPLRPSILSPFRVFPARPLLKPSVSFFLSCPTRVDHQNE